MDYREHTQTIEVPKGTGTRGFLHAIAEILKLDRVQGINIDARGKVSYTRYIREGADAPDLGLRLNFETLMPYAVVRNGRVDELVTSGTESPVIVVARMFAEVSKQKLFPMAFVTGANTVLFDWLERHGVELVNQDELFGLPVFRDRLVEDYVLIIAAAYGRTADFTDTQQSFKIVMPQRTTDNAFASNGNRKVGDPSAGDAQRVPSMGVPGRAVNGSSASKPGGGNSGNRGGAAE